LNDKKQQSTGVKLTDLRQFVIDKIEKNGPITFAEFMDIALYYPEAGYYQKENPFGTQGSFYTSVNASETFGKSIGRGCIYMAETLELPMNLCEMGAGSGMLANDVLNVVKNEFSEQYKNLTYTIIEKSEYLIERQKELLKEHEGKVRWTTFEELNNFEGIFFSNELVDAFPVHRVIRMEQGLKEIFAGYTDGEFHYALEDFSTPELQEYLDRINLKVVTGQIVDLNLDSVHWVRALADKIKKGVVLTIDYGYEAPQLFSSHRRDGTVTCYHNHKQNNDFFDRIGEQDITAFVDFTTLGLCGKEKGLEPVALMPQWLFLVQSGILEEIKAAENDVHRASIKSLIMPEGGFGTNFHVFLQTKNLEVPQDFRYKKKAAETFEELAEIFK